MTFAVQFIFTPGEYDEEFHTLDQAIDEFAHAHPGFIGSDKWQSADGTRQNSIYYWKDRESLGEFSRYPQHLEAKANYRRWYESFQVVISEVTAHYGDGGQEHPLRTPAAPGTSEAEV